VQAGLKVAVQVPLGEVGVDLANWNWKVVRRCIEQRCGRRLSRSTGLRYLHRLGFVFKRPKKRLLKADAAQRAAFLEQYAALVSEAAATGAKIFFVDEAHFRADADLRGKWVLKGQPALGDSTSPRWGEKASYYSAVCLETAEVEYMELTGNSTAETSAAFLRQLRATHPGPLIVIWDNGPAHGGEALRTYLATPALDLRLIRLPAYSPDFNADEAIWGWAREEVTGNTCLGTKALVQEKMAAFFAGLTARTAEVQTRCQTQLQALTEALPAPDLDTAPIIPHGDSICALV
jgi:transposase